MFRSHFFAFLLTFAAFVLLVLTTFSVPFVSSFFFLDASASGGVRFGVWGWCLDSGETCSPKQLGYSFETEIIAPLTRALVLFPIAAGLSLLALLTLVPVLCTHRRDRYYPPPFFPALTLLAALSATVAFILSIALFGIARTRFSASGAPARFGPLPWMALAAAIALLLVALSSGCGALCRGRCGRAQRYQAYNV